MIDYPVDYMGPLAEGGRRSIDVRPMSVASGIQLPPGVKPVLGNQVTVDLITDVVDPNSAIASTKWTYTISFGGEKTGPVVPLNSTLTTASFNLSIPGAYTIKAETTYRRTNPYNEPHAPTTKTMTLIVAPPTTAIPIKEDLGKSVPEGVATIIRDVVKSGDDKIGPYAQGGVEQRVVTYRDFRDEDKDLPTSSFWSEGSSNVLGVTDGILYDTVGPDAASIGGTRIDWVQIPLHGVIAEYTQELRYVWTMVVPGPEGTQISRKFSVPLNEFTGLKWRMVKDSNDTWTINLVETGE